MSWIPITDRRPQRVIAKDHGISKSTVGNIKRREVWQHVTAN